MNLKQIPHVYLEVAEMHLGSVLIPLVFVMRVLTAAFVVLRLHGEEGGPQTLSPLLFLCCNCLIIIRLYLCLMF